MISRPVKIIIATALIAVLAWGVDWSQASQMATRISWWAIAVMVIIMVLELMLSTWKWSAALQMHGLRYPYGYLLRSVFIGFFLNNFLPTSIGGDAFRVYRTLPPDGFRSRAVSSILVDRITGLAALMTLGAVGAAVLFEESPVARAFLLLYLAGGTGGAVGLYAVYRGWFRPLTNRVRHFKAFVALEHNLDRLKSAKGLWLRQIGLSFLFQLLSIAGVYWLFLQTGAVSPQRCALITAAGGMAALVPLSINGIGLLEGGTVAMAVALGVDYNTALVVAVVRRFSAVTVSLMCGIVYMAEGRPAALPVASEPTSGA